MTKDFHQVTWDAQLRVDWQRLLELAVREDLGQQGDWTSRALVPEGAPGRAAVVVRQTGVVAGLPAVQTTLASLSIPASAGRRETEDGRLVERGGGRRR